MVIFYQKLRFHIIAAGILYCHLCVFRRAFRLCQIHRALDLCTLQIGLGEFQIRFILFASFTVFHRFFRLYSDDRYPFYVATSWIIMCSRARYKIDPGTICSG